MAKNTSYNRNRNKKQETAPEAAFVEGFLQGVWQLGSWMFKQLAGKGGNNTKQVNAEQLQALKDGWGQVEFHVLQEATHTLAISEGDKILDNALKLLGFQGESMADRLRNAEERFGTELYQSIWQAHKLRNTLAHEVGARASQNEVQKSVATFRQALYQLGILD